MTRKPGQSWATMGTLPMAAMASLDRDTTESAVSRPGITSTSFIAWTGLKKWRPRKRSGLPERKARSVTERVDVFVAKTRLRAAEAVEVPEEVAFDLPVLYDRLDDEVRGPGRPLTAVLPLMRPMRRPYRLGVSFPFFTSDAHLASILFMPLRDEIGGDIDENDVNGCRRKDMGYT